MKHKDVFIGRYAQQLNDLTWGANRAEREGRRNSADSSRQARWAYWDAQVKDYDMPGSE